MWRTYLKQKILKFLSPQPILPLELLSLSIAMSASYAALSPQPAISVTTAWSSHQLCTILRATNPCPALCQPVIVLLYEIGTEQLAWGSQGPSWPTPEGSTDDWQWEGFSQAAASIPSELSTELSRSTITDDWALWESWLNCFSLGILLTEWWTGDAGLGMCMLSEWYHFY